MQRRAFLGTLAGGLALGRSASARQTPVPAAPQAAAPPAHLKGQFKQGVTRGVFRGMTSLDDMSREAAKLGIKGFDLIAPADWPTLKKYGLVPSMYQGPAGSIASALNNLDNHTRLEPTVRAGIDQAAENGVPNIITFAGGRNANPRGTPPPPDIPDAQGADNCVAFLNKVKAQAEDKGITLCMEYLNSKVNHPGYMFDHIAWGVDVMKRVNSPRVKILYDIYHAQIMDGDIIRNIRTHYQWIGHFHTGGNPGRNDIDDTQELNYHAIMQAIADLGYQGFVSHEYSPAMGHDPIKTLEKAIEICTV